MPEEDESFNLFGGLLKLDGPIAITVKQSLAPASADDAVIFPPSYPVTVFKGRVYTMRDGDYRVSVELPPDSKRNRGETNSDQTPGYNIDRFPDGTNSCEIDSPQSQANRIEPIFAAQYRSLVPQIEIRVGTSGTKVNLLVDAGHRAADAVVRMSSLADKVHTAFLDVKAGNHFTLATIAPTSLLFGVWDSRSTQVKIQRIIKAQIRASNVHERTRSAHFTPAADYTAAGAVDPDLDSGKGDENPLSEQGMLHALATQTVGGVMLTGKSELTRTVALNLAAVRELRAGADAERTRALQHYILGLALLAATADPDLNLREGSNLRIRDASDEIKLVPRRGNDTRITLDRKEIEKFAAASAKQFFALAEIDFGSKDHLDAIFETGVAEAFLAKSKEDRAKISRTGPITAATIRQFEEKGNDPFKLVLGKVKEAQKAIGKAPRKAVQKVVNLDAFKPVAEAFRSILEDASLADDVRTVATELEEIAREHDDSHEALKKIQKRLKEFRKAREQQKADAVNA